MKQKITSVGFVVLTLTVMLMASQAQALDLKRCNSWIYKKGWFGAYKYPGILWLGTSGTSQATRDKGFFGGSFASSTENSTASIDPGISSKSSSSESQSISSWGACRMIGLQLNQEVREKYLAQNFEEIKTDSARGEGLHLDNLAFFYSCQNDVVSNFGKVVQKSYSDIFKGNEQEALKKVDTLVASDPVLSAQCNI